jgi:hypothetical protein
MMNIQKTFRKKHSQGLAMVEFALIMPLILMLMYCVAEFTHIQMQANTLAKSVRDGTRYLADNAIVGTTGVIDVTQAETRTKNLVVYGLPIAGGTPRLRNFSPEDVQVFDLGDNLHIGVTATYTFTPIFALQIPTFGILDAPISLQFPLQATVIMRAL